MAPQRHRYTKCILFTGQRANKSNERVVCKYCSEAESPQWALQNALLCNTKKLVKSHLRRCRYFHAAQASGDDESIVFTEDEDEGDEFQQNANKTNKRKVYLHGVVGTNTSNSSTNSRSNDETEDSKKNDSTSKRLKLDRVNASGAASALTKLTRSGAGAATAGPDQEALERLLLNATLANGWAFSWIDQRASIQLLQSLQPYVRLPASEALAGRILKAAGEKEATLAWNAVEKERLGCTMVLDSWRQVETERVLGSVLTTSQGEVLVWSCKDVRNISQLRTNGGGSMSELLTSQLTDLGNSSVNVIAVIAESSDGYARARRVIRKSRRDLMVLPCVAHQLNAFIADVFKLVPTFHKVIRIAFGIAALAHSVPLFEAKLREKQRDLGLPAVVVSALVGEVEWESLRNLTTNLLATKDALVALISDDDEDSLNSQIPEETLSAIRNTTQFWLPLVDLDSILFHVARWISIIKLHQGRLHYVPLIKHSIAAALQHQLVPDVGSPLLERLESRWDEWEQPLLILSVALNPAFGWSFIDNSSGVTLMRLGCWARYYYEAFFGCKPQTLQNELLEYTEGEKFWCSPASVSSFATPVHRAVKLDGSPTNGVEQDDAELLAKLSFKVVQYWKSCSTDCPELSKLALRIFAVAVTSVATDGLFAPTPASSGPGQHNQQLQLAAMRVRARTKYDQGTTPVVVHPGNGLETEVDPSDTTEAVFEAGCVMSQQKCEQLVKLDLLLERWSDQLVQDRSDDSGRETSNEDEAINTMYSKIHPADDKFSKYAIQTLFQTP